MMSGKSAPEGSRSGRSANGTEEPAGRKLQVGVGKAIAHHGELLQGVFEGEDRRLHRALLTLPLAVKQSTITFWPKVQSGINTRPADRRKSLRLGVRFRRSHAGHAS